MKLITIRCTPYEAEQLLQYVKTRDRGADEGWYYGNKDQFERRHASLLEILEQALSEPDRSELLSERDRLRSALKWYAKHLGASKSMDMRIITQDGGKRAREALAGAPSEPEKEHG